MGGVIFGAAEDFPGRLGDNLDLVYRLGENEWNGATRVELKIVDARLSRSAVARAGSGSISGERSGSASSD